MTFMTIRLWFAAALMILVAFGQVKNAEPTNTVSVSGRMCDYNNVPIRHGTVLLTKCESGEDQTVQTNEDGVFLFPSVRPNQRCMLSINGSAFSPTLVQIHLENRNLDLGTVVLQPFGSTGSSAATTKPRSSSTVYLSGRIVDAKGVPVSGKTLGFRDLSEGASPIANPSTIRFLAVNENGRFVFPAQNETQFQLFLGAPGPPPLVPLAMTEIVADENVDIGDVALQTFSEKERQTVVKLVGPMRKAGLPSRIGSSGQDDQKQTITAMFVDGDGAFHALLSDGKQDEVPKQKEQVGAASVKISEDRRTVGWLVDSNFCCTSYPLSLMLVVYRPGKPLAKFTGDGRAIFNWDFEADGKQVEFYQDYPHGTPVQHYSLVDVETGKLVAEWGGEITSDAPEWVKDMQ